MEEKNFMYDKFSDRLFISNNSSKNKIFGSIRFHNLTLDFSQEKKLINIEMKNVSEYLEMMDINPEILNRLIEAKFTIKQTREGYLACMIITAPNEKRIVPFNFQTNKSITISS